jgi:putative spermidine/putrescine transport system permease protein
MSPTAGRRAAVPATAERHRPGGSQPLKRLADDAGFLLLVVAMAVTVVYIVAPILVSLSMSLDGRNYLGRFPPEGLSLQWYVKLFQNDYFVRSLVTSLQIATLTTVITGVLGVAAAVVLSEHNVPGRTGLITLFLSPLMVPGVVIGFGLLMFMTTVAGITDGFVRILTGHVIITLPYMIRATLAGLTGIRATLGEAALSLGANERRAFWDVTFPLARTGIITGCVFTFTISLDDVAVTLFLYDPQTVTLPVALITYMRANFDLSVAAAAIFLAGVTLLLIILLDRFVGLDRVIGQGIYRA